MRYLPSSAQRRKFVSEDISLARAKQIDAEVPQLPVSKNTPAGWGKRLIKALSKPGFDTPEPDPFTTAPEPMGTRSNIAGELPLDQLSRPHQAKQSGVKSPPPNISPRI